MVDNLVAQMTDMATELATLEDNLLRGAMPETAAAIDRQRRIQLLVSVQQLMNELQEYLDQKQERRVKKNSKRLDDTKFFANSTKL